LRAAVPARPFGAAVRALAAPGLRAGDLRCEAADAEVRALEADRLAAGFFALDLVGDVCFVATGVRVPFVAPLRTPRERVPVGSDKGVDRQVRTRKGQARGVVFGIIFGGNT
jgi:hypothetical protein